MRVHIDIDPEIVARVDAASGPRGRSDFIRAALAAALDRQERAVLVHASRGSIPARGHDWDDDPAAWVRGQRSSDARRRG